MLPAYFIDALPHSLSSIWWGGDHGFSKDGNTLILKINLPTEKGVIRPATADLSVTLADGKVAPPKGAVWKRALAKARSKGKKTQ